MRKKFILNLFDGDAGAEGGAGSNGGETTKPAISSETKARARDLGLSDDMLQDYQAAFGKADEPKNKTETGKQEENNENAESNDDADREFEELIKGKYRDSYQKRMSTAIKDRVSKLNGENRELQTRVEQGDRILKMLEGKYELDPNDPDALYNAVKGDSDIWRERAISTGGSIEDAVNAFEDAQRQNAEHEELENYRRQEQIRQLDMRLQGLAAETAKKYPEFDLAAEFENPRFTQALDFIAAQNEQRNSRLGRNDEIYDLTYAYELAHADELQKKVIERTSKATASAYAQTIAANRAHTKSTPSQSAVSEPAKIDFLSMSDDEIEKYKREVLAGKRHIMG